MASLKLALFILYLALGFRTRTVLQLRRTGSTCFKGVSGRPGSAELFLYGPGRRKLDGRAYDISCNYVCDRMEA